MKIATKPNEIICMTMLMVPVEEGQVPLFVAFDQFSHFCFMAEPFEELNYASMMAAVGKLMDSEDLQRSDHRDFTLLVDFGEDIMEELDLIARQHEGRVVFDPGYVREATEDDLRSLFESMF